jgi:hypothetical protein
MPASQSSSCVGGARLGATEATPVAAESASNVTVRVLQKVEEVEGLRDCWSAWPGTRDSDIDTLLSVCRTSPDVLAPYVIVAQQRGGPSALLAGRIVRRNFALRIGYFDLFKPLLNVLTIPYGGLRGDASPEVCELFVAQIIKSLSNRLADVGVFEHLDSESPLFRSARSSPSLPVRDHFLAVRPHWRRVLPPSIEQLHAGLSGHEKKRFRQIAKKLNTDFSGSVRVERCGTPSDLGQTLDIVEEIARKSWQRQSGIGFNTSEALSEFLRMQAERGWLRIYILYLAEKPCAFWMGANYQGTFFNDFIGYDPVYARYSLGTYLLSKTMEEFCSEGLEAIDFGFTDDEYKRRFGNLMRLEGNVHIFARSPKGVALSAMKAMTTMLHEPTRKILERTNLTQKVKKIWRSVSGRREKQGAQ